MRAITLFFAALVVGVTASAAPTSPQPRPGSFAELADFRSTPKAKLWHTLQASGFDRGGGFYDSGNFLRVEPGRRYVMLETEGPGCIDRMWFTRKSTEEPYDLLFYLDNREEPALRIGMDELCSGARSPFVAPFVGSVNLARYCYVPIAYKSYCKVVLVPTAPPERYTYRENSAGEKILHVYYQLTYRALAKGTPVRAFRSDLESAETSAMKEVADQWLASGTRIWSAPLGKNAYMPPAKEQRREAEVNAGGETELFALEGPGTIRELRLCLKGSPAANSLRLQVFWDGIPQPAISAPLGSFFAAPDPRVNVRGLWLGASDGEYYCYLPMPFRRSARVVLRSEADQPVTVSARLSVSPGKLDEAACYLQAQAYDYSPPLPAAPYEVVNTTGKGHFVGLVMDRPGNMEGDDQFYVDGERQPSIHGTGTEDFFSFAWGFSHLAALPLHGITRHHGAAIPYRFHLPAGVPFQKSLRLVFEHGHGNEHQGRYSGVAFYYLKPN